MTPASEIVKFKNPPWNVTQNLTHMKNNLWGKVTSMCPMDEYLREDGNKQVKYKGTVFAAILGGETKAVIKFQEPYKARKAYHEFMAYEIYEQHIAPQTGNHLVPPTVVREVEDGRVFSCQYFVETGPDEDYVVEKFRERALRSLDPDLSKELSVFLSVFGRWDNHSGNLLATIGKDGKAQFALIDNESISDISFIEYFGETPFVEITYSKNPPLEEYERKIIPLEKGTYKEVVEKTAPYGFELDEEFINSVIEAITQNGGKFDKIGVWKDRLFVPYFKGSKNVFELPKGPYPPKVIEAYQKIDIRKLEGIYSQMPPSYRHADPKEMAACASERIEQFLEAALEASEA